ncbi:MAG TPA: tail fiber domain-containing protein [Chitinophagales bacterium]|nr:tail fiber domain-containing protein [Chitinophagales bacterium]
MKPFSNILKYSIIIAVVFISQFANAQWSITGNSGINSSTNFLGTTDSKPLIIRTNNVERFRITSAGKLGFGTTSPASTFDLVGSFKAGGIEGSCKIDTSGNFTFTGNGALRIQNNKYIFKLATGSNGGGYYSKDNNRFELRDTFTTRIFSVGISSGDGYLKGGLQLGNSTNNVAGNIRWTGSVFEGYNGSSWQSLSGGGGSGWSLTGNAGTNSSTNFIGTTDNQALVLKVNNQLAGKIDNGNSNIFLGYKCGNNNTTGSHNAAVGSSALYNNTTGSKMVAVGDSALFKQTVNGSGFYDNVGVGYRALCSNTSGYSNEAVGANALSSNTTGYSNTANGDYSLVTNTTGFENTALGRDALHSNTTAYGNVALGKDALFTNSTGANNSATGTAALKNNSTGIGNVATGTYALYSNTTGSTNVGCGVFVLNYNDIGTNNAAIGTYAGYKNTSGNANVFAGDSAGYANTTGSNNTYVGFKAKGNATLTNATAIGSNASVTASNALVLGSINGTNGATSNCNVGIGTTSPTHSRLEINGNVGAAVAMFGADKTGVAIQADNPEIGFNYYYNGGTKTIHSGYASVVGMDPVNGNLYFANFNGNQSSSNFGSITGYQTAMTIKQNCSIAGGLNSSASGPNSSMAFGYAVTASGSSASGFGSNTIASGDNSLAAGYLSHAVGNSSAAIGNGNVSDGENAMATGNNTSANGTSSFTSGFQTSALASNAAAFGNTSTASGENSFAVGDTSLASGNNSVAFGNNCSAFGTNCFAMGDNVHIGGTNNIGIGTNISYNGVSGCDSHYSLFLGGNTLFTMSSCHGFSGYTINNRIVARFGSYEFQTDDDGATYCYLSSGAGSWDGTSDRNKKRNFTDVNTEDVLEKIGNLPMQEWNYIHQPETQKHIGCMAQDFFAAFHLNFLENAESETRINTFDIDGVNMAGIQALKIRTDSLKETNNRLSKELLAEQNTNAGLQSAVSDLQNELAEIKQQLQEFDQSLSQCCTNYQSSMVNGQGSIANDIPKLDQNIPNPFNQTTIIKFYLPQIATSAVIKIYSLDGVELKSFNVTQNGYGEISIAAHSLASGVYAYALIIDGVAIDTKQMIITK